MSEKCPTCTGPVEINEVLVEYGGPGKHIEHKKEYRSTAAEQLAIHNKLMEQGADKITELRTKLADKEREFEEQKKVEALCIEELLEAEEQLADANAVVDKLHKQLAATKAITDRQIKLDTTEIDRLEQQLADKDTKLNVMHARYTAANAVVDFAESLTESLEYHYSKDMVDLKNKCAEYRKLQGGDGE